MSSISSGVTSCWEAFSAEMDKLMGSDLNDKSSITELWKASYVHPCVSHETPVCAEFANCFLKEINNLLTVK